MAPNLARYNAVPACLAHSYLILNCMLKILALHSRKVAINCYLYNTLLVSVQGVVYSKVLSYASIRVSSVRVCTRFVCTRLYAFCLYASVRVSDSPPARC
jgi:hypothetical protein